jgi:hypothetical protein
MGFNSGFKGLNWLVGDASSLLGYYDLENEGTEVLRNIDKYLPMNTA